MPGFTSGNTPGFGTALETEESQVWWAGRDNQHMIATANVTLKADEVDAGNTPTSTIRGGTILAIEAGSGIEAYVYDPDGLGGKDCAAGVLENAQDMLVSNTSTDRFINMMTHGLLKGSELPNIDAQARAQLSRCGFMFDGAEPEGAAFLVHAKRRIYCDGSRTVTAADNGCHFIYGGTADGNFTLPTIAVGLSYEFTNVVDFEMAITGDNNIVALHDLSASTLTFTTGSE
ncbi:MAG: hypothetical protein HQ546_07025, partial [Planctomycetes bacterium]|nr:hypothetical protein [Planctomycetota bacterium]